MKRLFVAPALLLSVIVGCAAPAEADLPSVQVEDITPTAISDPGGDPTVDPTPVELSPSQWMVRCFNNCQKTHKNGNWCVAYCDCVRKGNDSRYCDFNNPYIDL